MSKLQILPKTGDEKNLEVCACVEKEQNLNSVVKHIWCMDKATSSIPCFSTYKKRTESRCWGKRVIWGWRASSNLSRVRWIDWATIRLNRRQLHLVLVCSVLYIWYKANPALWFRRGRMQGGQVTGSAPWPELRENHLGSVKEPSLRSPRPSLSPRLQGDFS